MAVPIINQRQQTTYGRPVVDNSGKTLGTEIGVGVGGAVGGIAGGGPLGALQGAAGGSALGGLVGGLFDDKPKMPAPETQTVVESIPVGNNKSQIKMNQPSASAPDFSMAKPTTFDQFMTGLGIANAAGGMYSNANKIGRGNEPAPTINQTDIETQDLPNYKAGAMGRAYSSAETNMNQDPHVALSNGLQALGQQNDPELTKMYGPAIYGAYQQSYNQRFGNQNLG